MKKCYAYIRVSTLKQKEKSSSLEMQRLAITTYAARNGIELMGWFEEWETAAKRGRPAFSKLVKLIRSRSDIGVVIHKIDRGARNLKDWADLGELIDAGVEIHFAHESLDLQSRGGRLAADIQAVVAADYVRNLRQEVRKGIEGRLREGLLPNRAPLGYLDTGKGNVKAIDPVLGPLVAKAFELCASRAFNLEQLRDRMYELGLRTRRGGKVQKSCLSRMLNNPFYYGRIFVRRTNQSYLGVHTPIVSVALFSEVQAHLTGRKKNAGLVRRYAYQQMLKCRLCTRMLVPEFQKGQYTYYRCHTGSCPVKCIREEEVSRQLLMRLSFEVDAAQISLLRDGIARRRKRVEVVAASWARTHKLAIVKLEDRIARLMDLLLDGAVDQNVYAKKNAELIQEKLQLQELIQHAQSGEDQLTRDAKTLLEQIESLPATDFSGTPEELSLTAKRLCSNLWIAERKLFVSWLFPLSSVVREEILDNGAPSRSTSRTLDLNLIIGQLAEGLDDNVPTSPQESS